MSSAPADDDDLRQTTVSPSRSRAQQPYVHPAHAAGALTPRAASWRAAPVEPGEVLAGKYQVGSILGQGGVGVVVAATHLLLQQKVAIKMLLDETDTEHLSRFLREGQAAGRLKGEHVARVLDMGQLPSGAPFMVMEFLEGRDMAAHLEQHGPMALEEAAELLLHACEAMAEAHAAGIVHRDLKPANLFLTRAPDGAPRLKVVDFGISKDLGDPMAGDHRLTRTTSVFGSPLYMSPEQMRSTRLTDARSDIWALGVILYELLAGRTPFDAELYPDLVLKVATEPPAPLSSARGDLPPALEGAILRCLEKRPEHRFQNVGQLAAAIAPFAPARAQGALERILRFVGPAAAQEALEAQGAAGAATQAAPGTTVTTVMTATPAAPAAAAPRSMPELAPPESTWAQTAGGSTRYPRAPRRELYKVGAAVAAGALLTALGAAALLWARGEGAGPEPEVAVHQTKEPAPATTALERAEDSARPTVTPAQSAALPAESAAAAPPPEAPARPTSAPTSRPAPAEGARPSDERAKPATPAAPAVKEQPRSKNPLEIREF